MMPDRDQIDPNAPVAIRALVPVARPPSLARAHGRVIARGIAALVRKIPRALAYPWTWPHGECEGVNFPPLELSDAGLRSGMERARRRALAAQERLGTLDTRPTLSVPARGPLRVMVDISPGDERYDVEIADKLHRQTRFRDAAFAAHLRWVELVAAWQPDELPEVRYPRRQPLKLQKELDAVQDAEVACGHERGA